MLLDLTDVLSEQHKPIDKEVEFEMDQYKKGRDTFPIIEKRPVHLQIEYVPDQKLRIKGETSLSVVIPCDRCLVDVKTHLKLDFLKEVDLSEDADEAAEELDEKNYIEGHSLDVDQLIRNEMLIAWPMKILCREDCEGIIYEKDEALDPRMAAALDVFKKFQEK